MLQQYCSPKGKDVGLGCMLGKGVVWVRIGRQIANHSGLSIKHFATLCNFHSTVRSIRRTVPYS